MKKILIRVVLMMGMFAFVLSNAGCSKKPETVENEVEFSTYTQQERKDYVSKYLTDNYKIKCNISDVKQRQVTAIKNEEYYFATATTDDGKIISVWITGAGEITDTFFLNDLSDVLVNHFTSKANEILPGCKVKAYTEMREIPTSKLSRGDDIESYLYNQPAYTYIRVFVDSDVNLNNDIVNDLQAAFNYCDASLYVYICEDVENIDINTYDLTSYTYEIDVEKGK